MQRGMAGADIVQREPDVSADDASSLAIAPQGRMSVRRLYISGRGEMSDLCELLSTKVTSRFIEQQAANSRELMRFFGFDQAPSVEHKDKPIGPPPTINLSEVMAYGLVHCDFSDSQAVLHFANGGKLYFEVSYGGYTEYESSYDSDVTYVHGGRHYQVIMDTKPPKKPKAPQSTIVKVPPGVGW